MLKLALALLVAVPAVLPTPLDDKADVMATINQFVDGFNKGDPGAAAACAEKTSIIDEFPPYQWDGKDACQAWMKAYNDDATKNGITEGIVTLGTPRHLDISGEYAYVVIPSDYAFKLKGKPMKETSSTFTFALKKKTKGWRIVAWSWGKN